MDKVLLAEKEYAGTGELEVKDTSMGECEYRLDIRKSRIKIKAVTPDGLSKLREKIMVTVMGTVTIKNHKGQKLAEQHVIANRESAVLHISDDFLLVVSLCPTKGPDGSYKAFGRIVTEASSYACPYL
jgi:hypothetical protein